MSLILLSFIAGLLTVLAPCVFPLLPIILGGSTGGKSKFRPYIVIVSLMISVVIFTLVLRFSTVALGLPAQFWQFFSGGILILMGLFYLFPEIWDKISGNLNLLGKSEGVLNKADEKDAWYSPILLGFSLGPVFNSCSPTYLALVGIVLRENFFFGLVNIIVYTLGLGLIMLIIALLGRQVVSKLRWAADPNGYFKKILGLLFIFVGLSIALGLDKDFEAWLLDQGYFGSFLDFENEQLKQLEVR